MPRIRDVETMVELLADLGADVEWTGPNEVRVARRRASHKTELDEELCRRIRASFLLAGPLLARFGRASVPPPGGDVIGRRRLDPHIHAFAELGVEIAIDGRYEHAHDAASAASTIFLDEASVMATENAVMAAVLADGRDRDRQRRLRAARPGSLPLPRLARRADRGDRVERAPHRGRRGARRRRAARSAPEHIEVASFIGLAAVTGGDLTIDGRRTRRPRLDPARVRAARRARSRSRETSVRVPPGQELVIQDDLGGQIPKIEDGPWPAFPADLTSIALAVATQAQGTILIFEKMFESRLFFVDKLVAMGARIILCDPHRAVVTGPAQLYGERMDEPGHPRRHGDADRGALRRGHLDDRQRRRDRPRLRADRRAPARPRRADRARRPLAGSLAAGMGAIAGAEHGGARVEPAPGSRAATSPPGSRSLDHLLGLLARSGRLRPLARGRAGRRRGRGRRGRARALGDALAGRSAPTASAGTARRSLPADEALAQVALEASGRPLARVERRPVGPRVGGLATRRSSRASSRRSPRPPGSPCTCG